MGRELVKWLPVGIIPILNGIIRMATYGKTLPSLPSGLVSSALDVALIALYALLLQRKDGSVKTPPRFRGGLWLALSTFSHFMVGHFAFGLSWWELARKYDVFQGQTWGVISLAIALSPALAAKVASRRLAASSGPL